MSARKPPPMSHYRVEPHALGELERLADEIDGRAAERLLGRVVREAVRR